MASYDSAQRSKREAFHRYLENRGVIDSLISVLTTLYELQEKPCNALEFIKQHLGDVGHISTDVVVLQGQIRDLRQRCAVLTEENKKLKKKLLHHEPKPKPEKGV